MLGGRTGEEPQTGRAGRLDEVVGPLRPVDPAIGGRSLEVVHVVLVELHLVGVGVVGVGCLVAQCQVVQAVTAQNYGV